VTSDALPSWSDLLALVKQLEGTDFEDFVVEMPGLTVRVSRHGLAEMAASTPAVGIEPDVIEAAAVKAVATGDDAAHTAGTEVAAPIVGVFFRKPAPDQPPFVEIGDDVGLGSTMAVIEVMKMMVPVEASVAGRVVAVLAEDGDLVEADQPLFVVDASGVT
jgi:acetyl-CoA carboxylase biotin carboxyl carrier protein